MMKFLQLLIATIAFIFSFLIWEISSVGGFHGIRIPDDVTEKLIKNLDPQINITQGTLKGKAELSRNGRVFLSFKGIPFGKVPQRFNDPVPAEGWKGIRDAKEYGPKCSQLNFYSVQPKLEGDEDCLSINIFVPKVEGNAEKLPVMFYAYGGRYLVGESNIYHANYFMDEDVVLVVPNYRVGAYGFLNAGIKGASGNQGLKDLVLALQWVQENIRVFGGDPSRVVIFGQSAGGGAVSNLVISPMAKGLFSAAIAQSVVATVGFSFFPDPDFDAPKKLAQAVDCPTSNREYMVECLRKIRPEVLSKATQVRDPVWFERESYAVMAPSIETYREFENETNVFMPDNPEIMLDKGHFNKVPFMLGFTSSEGLSSHSAAVLLNPNTTKRMNEEWGRVVPQTLFYWSTARDPCKVSGKIRETYFKDQLVGRDTAMQLTNMYSHVLFQYPVRKVGLKHAKHAPVYLYNFTKQVKHSALDLFGYYKETNPLTKPPAHADEMQYLFSGLEVWPDIKKDSPDKVFSSNMVKMWVSFAQNHKPTHTWGSHIQQPIQPVNPDAETPDWIQIDDEVTIQPESKEFTDYMKVQDEICENDLNYCSSLKK